MLDCILSLGVTSVLTDMIHVHSNDVFEPRLSYEQAKSLLSSFHMPPDDIHLISMKDYEFKTEETSLEELRKKVSYLENTN